MLISKTNKDGHLKLPIPHETPAWISVVPMSQAVADLCKSARISEHQDNVSGFDPQVVAAVIRDAPAPDKDKDKSRAVLEPYDAYSRPAILENCIVAWSYDVDPIAETIGSLDPYTADWCAREIYRLSKRETAEEQKNA